MKNIILLVAFCLLSGCKITSEGSKIGIIVKCANEGFFVKTYECEIIRGGMNSASGTIGKSFNFTVEDKSMMPLIEKAFDQQEEVRIYYHRELFAAPWRNEKNGNYFLDKIEFVKKDIKHET